MIKLDDFSKVLADKILELTKGQGLPNGLTLDIETLLCMNLLEQLQTETISKESLINEAKELGVPQEVDINRGLEVLSEKGYLSSVAEDSFEFLPPFQEATETLKQIFPSMHGISMLAYMVQTLEEVSSARKELTQAVSQFADTLQIHSISSADSDKPPSKEVLTKPTAQLLKALRDRAKKRARETSTTSSNLLSQDEEVSAKGLDVFDLFGAQEEEEPLDPEMEATHEPEAMPSDEPEQVEVSASEPPGQEEEDQEKEPEDSHIPEDLPEIGSEPQPTEIQQAPEAPLPHTDGTPSQETTIQMEAKLKDSGEAPEEQELEERIRQFEQELAQLCPLCGKGRIQERQTASGKKYYQCDQKMCQFISWGKPLIMPCPRCNNPFLVEIESDSGQTIAKCPRATCGYKGDPSGKFPSKTPTASQPGIPPGPKVLAKAKKRRVRRRVVRKK